MTPAINWALIVIGAVLILVEVLLGAISGFDFLLIGSAILLGGALGLLVRSAPLGLAAAGVLSLLYVFVGRRKIRERLKRPGIASNTDAVLGRTGLVVEPLAPGHPGRIKVEGEEWRALPDEGSDLAPGPAGAGRREDTLAAGAKVRVTRIDGVTAFVIPVETEPPAGGERK